MTKHPEHVSALILARFLALTPRRVRQLVEEDVLPKPTESGFPLESSVASYISHIRARKEARTFAAARLRRTEAQAKLLEIEVGLKEREILPADAVQKVWVRIIEEMRQKIEYSALSREAKNDILKDLVPGELSQYFNDPETPDQDHENTDEKHTRG